MKIWIEFFGMEDKNHAFEDFVDDCFIEKDPLCNISREKSLELVASQLIEELLSSEEDSIAA